MTALKAYFVQEEDEGTGGVVFAKSNAEARRVGSERFGDGDFHWGKARRAPVFDCYAPGPVPRPALIDCGWWYSCLGCDRKIGHDWEALNGQDSGKTYVETKSNGIYCCRECLAQTRKKEVMERGSVKASILAAKARLKLEYPTVKIIPASQTHAYYGRSAPGKYIVDKLVLSFRFPGMKIAPGNYTYFPTAVGKSVVSVCAGDKDAWTLFVKETRLRRRMGQKSARSV